MKKISFALMFSSVILLTYGCVKNDISYDLEAQTGYNKDITGQIVDNTGDILEDKIGTVGPIGYTVIFNTCANSGCTTSEIQTNYYTGVFKTLFSNAWGIEFNFLDYNIPNTYNTSTNITRSGSTMWLESTSPGMTGESSYELMKMFVKDPNESLIDAVSRTIFGSQIPKFCKVLSIPSSDASIQKNQQVTTRDDSNDYVQIFVDDAYTGNDQYICSGDYSQVNIMSFFLAKKQSDRFFWVNGGQDCLAGLGDGLCRFDTINFIGGM